MSSGSKLSSLFLLVLLSSWACAPDLDSLVAGNSGGSPGAAGSNGGSGGPPAGPGSCENNVRNSDETDIDCGGTSKCGACEVDLKCNANKDCVSEFCKTGYCADPTCRDGFKNGDETAIDCGGSCAPEFGCDLNVVCDVNEDCSSEFCHEGICADHCGSGKREADETDKDCGGSCDPCDDGSRCSEGSDCASLVCNNNECQPATCSDQLQNQDESDKDCGGVCVGEEKPCDINRHCGVASDCDSFVCTKGKCAPDITVLASDVIDSFEDDDVLLPTTGGRAGNWYWYGDGSGIANVSPDKVNRGSSSVFGLNTAGSDFTVWGSGIGVDLKNTSGMQSGKEPYDASAYSGVTFWARGATPLAVTVVFPDVDTDGAGGKCTVCDHHYFKSVQVSTDWQRFTIDFAEDLKTPEPGTEPAPEEFKPSGIIALQFRVGPGESYEFWIDDLAFVR
jgi:hypothetical protein